MTIQCYPLCCRSQRKARTFYSTLLEVHSLPLPGSNPSLSTLSPYFSGLFPPSLSIPHQILFPHPYTSQPIHSHTRLFHCIPNNSRHSPNDENISYSFEFDSQLFQWIVFFPWFLGFCRRIYQHCVGLFPSSSGFDSTHSLGRCRWWWIGWFRSHGRREKWVGWWRRMWRAQSKLIFFPSPWVGFSSVCSFPEAWEISFAVFLFPCIVFIFPILIYN